MDKTKEKKSKTNKKSDPPKQGGTYDGNAQYECIWPNRSWIMNKDFQLVKVEPKKIDCITLTDSDEEKAGPSNESKREERARRRSEAVEAKQNQAAQKDDKKK